MPYRVTLPGARGEARAADPPIAGSPYCFGPVTPVTAVTTQPPDLPPIAAAPSAPTPPAPVDPGAFGPLLKETGQPVAFKVPGIDGVLLLVADEAMAAEWGPRGAPRGRCWTPAEIRLVATPALSTARNGAAE
jgi:hypothetical protein